MRRQHLLFVRLIYCLLFALSLLGCAAPAKDLRWFQILPSRAEVDAEKARLAIRPELRTKLDAVVDQSCKMAENDRPNPRYIGQSYRDPLGDLQDKLVVAVLNWVIEEAAKPEPHLSPSQPRTILPVPPVIVQKPVDKARSLEDPEVQFGGGLAAGATIGGVPFGSMGADVAIQLRILPNGTYWARVGRACGEIAVGVGQIALGCAGMSAGAGMTSTGGGAIVGVPIVIDSFAIAVNGCATTINGIRHAGQLYSEGAPPEAPPPQSEVKILAPKPKPSQQAPVAAAPPPKAAAPPPAAKPTQAPSAAPMETRTTTRNKATGRTESKKASGTTTTTQPKGAPKESPQVSGVVEKTASGKRVGDFTRSQKSAAKAENAARNGGEMACTDCGRRLENVPSKKGVPTSPNQAQVHHDPPIVGGGGRHSTPVIVCPECHVTRHINE